MNDCCCAHCKVLLKHINYSDGSLSDYWECSDGCGQQFILAPKPTQLLVDRQEWEELKRDKERLDWLEKSELFYPLARESQNHVWEVGTCDDEMGVGDTIREAIDSAINQSKGTK